MHVMELMRTRYSGFGTAMEKIVYLISRKNKFGKIIIFLWRNSVIMWWCDLTDQIKYLILSGILWCCKIPSIYQSFPMKLLLIIFCYLFCSIKYFKNSSMYFVDKLISIYLFFYEIISICTKTQKHSETWKWLGLLWLRFCLCLACYHL